MNPATGPLHGYELAAPLLPGPVEVFILDCAAGGTVPHSGELVHVTAGCEHEHLKEQLCCQAHLETIREFAASPTGVSTCHACGTHTVMYRVRETGEVIRFGC